MKPENDEGTRADVRGILAMASGNVLLIANDTLVKLAADQLPMSEVICLRAIAAAAFLLLSVRLMSGPLPRTAPLLWGRAALEAGASLCYLYALQLIPIGELAGLQQIIPLAILAGAAVVFGERIGWRGWLAASIGLCGALLIIRPGMATSGAAGIAASGAVLAAAAVVFQVARDLLTRAMPPLWPPAFIAGTSQLAMIAGGLAFAPFDRWVVPPPLLIAQIVASALFLAIANYWLVIAMRSGRISVVGPFRYVGLIAALISGYFVWGQFPDAWSLVGSAIITASGLLSLWQSKAKAIATKLT
jgi:drug/metabolite transporter (DMT)-like permease